MRRKYPWKWIIVIAGKMNALRSPYWRDVSFEIEIFSKYDPTQIGECCEAEFSRGGEGEKRLKLVLVVDENFIQRHRRCR